MRNPEMKVGLAGDIPNATTEKIARVRRGGASGIATCYFGRLRRVLFSYSFWSLFVMSVPAAVGVGVRVLVREHGDFGYLNTSGIFWARSFWVTGSTIRSFYWRGIESSARAAKSPK